MIIVIFCAVSLIASIVLFIVSTYEIERYDEKYIYNENGVTRKYGKYIEPAKDKDGKDMHFDYYTEYPCDYHCKKRVSKDDGWDLGDRGSGFSLAGMIVFGIAILATGIPCLVAHGTVDVAKTQTTYEVRIEDLKDRENTIYLTLSGDFNLTVEDSSATTYHVIVDKPVDIMASVNEYNQEVKELKKDLYMEKVCSESPWINWFVSPGFKNVEGYNANAKSYRDILGDNLKTFELNTH